MGKVKARKNGMRSTAHLKGKNEIIEGAEENFPSFEIRKNSVESVENINSMIFNVIENLKSEEIVSIHYGCCSIVNICLSTPNLLPALIAEKKTFLPRLFELMSSKYLKDEETIFCAVEASCAFRNFLFCCEAEEILEIFSFGN
eukprot:Sdes_comp17578_c0_seq1m6826